MHSILFQIGPFTAYGYGFMIAVGIISAFLLSMHRAKTAGLDADRMFDLGLVGIIGGLAGAKLMYIIVEFPSLIREPSRFLNIGEGFVVYGGLICGFLSPLIYARIKKISFFTYLDLAVAGVAAAQGFGRIGCFLAGCCYGKETTAFFHVVFPENSLAPAGVPLIPTQLLSSAGDFLFAIFLILLSRRQKRPGETSACYLLFYSAGRFLIEFLRDDPRGFVGILSTSQFIAIIIFAVGAILFTAARKNWLKRLA